VESKLKEMGKRKKGKLPDTKEERIAELERELAEVIALNERLQKQVELLREKLEEMERAGRRQVRPFGRRELVAQRKKAGRKKGQGKFVRRAKPKPGEVKKTEEVQLHGCPECGGKVNDVRKHEQYEVDIPPVEPVWTRYVSYSGYCKECRKRVYSRHPHQVTPMRGAVGEVVIGPRAKALASNMKHRLGASYAKVSEVMNDAFGLQVERSSWCRADQRMAETTQPVYEKLVDVVRQCNVVHADETSWCIDTLLAWLWVFTNQEVTVYAIRDNRSSDVVLEILGEEFWGILVSDCLVSYDNRRLQDWLKQKCISHLLKDLKNMQENKSGRALHFARQLTSLLQEALKLKKDKPGLDPPIFLQRSQNLETRLDALIGSHRRLTNPDNARFAKRLRKHRLHLLRFLYVDDLEPTNNQAERMLRPAVITRKTNGCNRSRHGADTHAILASILATCRQHSVPILDYLVQLQYSHGNSPLPVHNSHPNRASPPT
jgi:hypothetical protein